MKINFDEVKNCKMFDGIDEAGFETLAGCLFARKQKYEKGSYIFSAGDAVLFMGIVLTGCVNIVHDDFWGNRTILANISEHGLFGEAFSCSGITRLPVSVIASHNTEVLLIDCKKILCSCTLSCHFHITLIKNMLKILSAKNVMLTQKIEFLTRKTTREKLLSYLSAQAQAAGKNFFSIPFNRQELADYLSVDRSAMSSELSKMQKDGIIRLNRSFFELIKTDW